MTEDVKHGTTGEVFRAFLTLGLTSFGGPVAHLSYYREAFVVRRKWLSEEAYADLVALCQFLPGPASSQVGMALGLLRAGYAGLLTAWVAFTLPSAVLMITFAYGIDRFGVALDAGWVTALKATAAAVVANALLGMARNLAPDKERATIAVAAMIGALFMPAAWGQIAVIALGALAGLVWLRYLDNGKPSADAMPLIKIRRRTAVVFLATFFLLLSALPLAATVTGLGLADLFNRFYQAGALVFGGGHVVLPLLRASVVEPGIVDNSAFLAGYGAAQALPGPLFAFAAYLGTVASTVPVELLGALAALVAIFLPGALLVVGVLPFWANLRKSETSRRVLAGVNAAVVGLLAAALYDPVFTKGITSTHTMALAAAAFIGLNIWRIPAWIVVVSAALIGGFAL